MKRTLSLLAILLTSAAAGFAQAKETPAETKPPAFVLASAAYSEILLRRTELEAEMESLAVDYTEDFPRLREIRFILSALKNETARLSGLKSADQSKLSLALGKLIVRKIEQATELWRLGLTYRDEHPDVKRAKRKVEIFETAIKEILEG